jgi:Spy/CpxP family protein refolding chaperone
MKARTRLNKFEMKYHRKRLVGERKRRRKMKIFGVMGLALAGVLLAGTGLAQGPGGGMGPGPGFGEHQPPMEKAFGVHDGQGRWWNHPKVVERLKLTEEQRKTFDGILLTHREKLIDLRANVEKAELEMEPLMRDDSPNEAKILAQIDKVAQARAELEKANARFLLAIRAKLTPEQWKLVQEFRNSHDVEGRGMDGRGMRPVEPGGNRPEGWKHHGQEPEGQYHKIAPPPHGEGPQNSDTPAAAPGPGAEQ